MVRMATTYDFTCPDGHKFKAIAKLRARCPDCGKMARRNFMSQSASQTQTISPVSSHKVVTPKDTGNGSKHATISTKIKESSSPPAQNDESNKGSSSESPPSTKKPIVVRQGMKRQMPKTVKQTTRAVIPPKKGPVTRKTARVGHAPTVTKPPHGSKERKVIEQTTDEPYWQKVKRQFFR